MSLLLYTIQMCIMPYIIYVTLKEIAYIKDKLSNRHLFIILVFFTCHLLENSGASLIVTGLELSFECVHLQAVLIFPSCFHHWNKSFSVRIAVWSGIYIRIYHLQICERNFEVTFFYVSIHHVWSVHIIILKVTACNCIAELSKWHSTSYAQFWYFVMKAVFMTLSYITIKSDSHFLNIGVYHKAQ